MGREAGEGVRSAKKREVASGCVICWAGSGRVTLEAEHCGHNRGVFFSPMAAVFHI